MTPGVKRTVTRVIGSSAACLLLGSVLGCGGEDSAAEQQPVGASSSAASASSESAPATESVSPSKTPKPKPSTRPLSRFEDEPPVIAARGFGATSARAINKGERDLATAARYLTFEGRERIAGYAAEDQGLYYPGPQPFTPTGVNVSRRIARVSVCWWGQGWAQDPETKLPARKRRISPAVISLKKMNGDWKVDDVIFRRGDCSKVPVKGVPW